MGAEDSEYAQAFGHWMFLLGAHRPRIIFEPSRKKRGAFRTQALDAQSMRKGESYLIVDAVSGAFVGVIRGVRASTIGGKFPITGRLYHLVMMGRA